MQSFNLIVGALKGPNIYMNLTTYHAKVMTFLLEEH